MYWFDNEIEEWILSLPERDHLAMLFTIIEEIQEIGFYHQVKSKIPAENLAYFESLSDSDQKRLLSDPIKAYASSEIGMARTIQHMRLIACFHDWYQIFRDIPSDSMDDLRQEFNYAKTFWIDRKNQTIEKMKENLNDSFLEDVLELYFFAEYWRPNEEIEQDLQRIWEIISRMKYKNELTIHALFFPNEQEDQSFSYAK